MLKERVRTFLFNNPAFVYFVVLGLIVLFCNYDKGTWLSGWDNIHSEFLPADNLINKSLFGIWQEGYGLGAAVANAPVTEIVRQPFIVLLALLLPDSLVRYVWHIGMLVLGGYGLYLLTNSTFYSATKIQTEKKLRFASLFAGTFYMLNLGTLQNFYVPVESFSHFFAFLPLLVLCILKLLNKPDVSSKRMFVIINVLAVPMNYFPTIFIVYLIIVGAILLGSLWQRSSIKSIIYIVLCIFLINAFWLLPFSYYVLSGKASDVQNARINKVFTADAYERNSVYGNIKDIALMKGLWFSTSDFVNGKYVSMLQPWTNHLVLNSAVTIGYVFAVGTLFGVALSLLKYRYHSKTLLFLFLVTFVALNSTNPPTGVIFEFLQKNIPLFKQVFRLSFTKFIPLAAFLYSIYLGYAVLYLEEKLFDHKKIRTCLYALLLVLLTYFSWPIFTGNFFYSGVRVTIPNEYFGVFSFFKGQDPNTRIANFPQPRFYGWVYYNWGYRGSGFPWYGIKQPVLDRAFDVWSKKNESYYNQVAQSLYTKNTPALENIFRKYGITWLWLDENQINPENPALLYNAELKSMLEESSEFYLAFETENQKIYQFNNLDIQDHISISDKVYRTASMPELVAEDSIFEKHGIYVTEPDGDLQPYSDLDSSQNLLLDYDKDEVGIYAKLQAGLLNLPSLIAHEEVTVYDTNIESVGGIFELVLTPVYPSILINGKIVPQEPSKLRVPLPNLVLALNKDYQVVLGTEILDFTYTGVSSLELGRAAIPNLAQVPVNIVERSQEYRIVDKKLIDDVTIDNCGEVAAIGKSSYARKIGEGDLTLLGKNSRPCIRIPLDALVGANTLSAIALSLKFDLSSNSELSVCVENAGNCFERIAFEPTVGKSVLKQVDLLIPDVSAEAANVKLELDAETLNIANQAVLHNLSYTYSSKIVYTGSLLLRALSEQNYRANTFEVAEGDSLLIANFPYVHGSLDKIGFSAEAVKSKAPKNCDPLRDGEFNRFFGTDFAGNSYVQYYAQNSSSCDSLSLPKLKYNTGFISVLKTMNLLGRPVTYCLKMDPPGYCMIFDIVDLPANGQDIWFAVKRVVPPVAGGKYDAYSVLFDNLSFSDQPRVNRVAGLDMYPIPYNWLKSISVQSAQDVMPSTVRTKTPYKVHELGSFLYVVEGDISGRTVLFYQGYDSEWLAINASNHRVFNSWGNSWTADGDVVILLYYPQLLSFLGLGALTVLLLLTIRKTSHKNL